MNYIIIYIDSRRGNMIHSKQDLKYYLNQDKLALHYSDDDKPSILKMKFGSGRYC